MIAKTIPETMIGTITRVLSASGQSPVTGAVAASSSVISG